MGKIIFKNLKDGEEITGVTLVASISDSGKAKDGNPFVSCQLTDGETTIKGNCFKADVQGLKNRGITAGNVYEVMICKSGPYYNIRAINICNDTTFSINDFAKVIDANPIDCYNHIIEMVQSVNISSEKKSIADLTIALLEEYKTVFVHTAAGKSVHHDAIGGLALHTEGVTRNACVIADCYPTLDKELLVCAAAIHDIGKIYEMHTDTVGQTTYTPAGRMLGHLCIGIVLIERYLANTPDEYDAERILLLEHLIGVHHARREWGAISDAAIPEADILFFLDNIDATVSKFEKAYTERNIEPGKMSEGIIPGFSNTVYKPTYR